jgi:hypothetical protein
MEHTKEENVGVGGDRPVQNTGEGQSSSHMGATAAKSESASGMTDTGASAGALSKQAEKPEGEKKKIFAALGAKKFTAIARDTRRNDWNRIEGDLKRLEQEEKEKKKLGKKNPSAT